ncbi:MAG: hypothetical protein WD768_11080 [Phycisphaeraceae bacterium]
MKCRTCIAVTLIALVSSLSAIRAVAADDLPQMKHEAVSLLKKAAVAEKEGRADEARKLRGDADELFRKVKELAAQRGVGEPEKPVKKEAAPGEKAIKKPAPDEGVKPVKKEAAPGEKAIKKLDLPGFGKLPEHDKKAQDTIGRMAEEISQLRRELEDLRRTVAELRKER